MYASDWSYVLQSELASRISKGMRPAQIFLRRAFKVEGEVLIAETW